MQLREERKLLRDREREIARLEREIERLTERERALNEEMMLNATDPARLGELQSELERMIGEREALESSWLEASESL